MINGINNFSWLTIPSAVIRAFMRGYKVKMDGPPGLLQDDIVNWDYESKFDGTAVVLEIKQRTSAGSRVVIRNVPDPKSRPVG